MVQCTPKKRYYCSLEATVSVATQLLQFQEQTVVFLYPLARLSHLLQLQQTQMQEIRYIIVGNNTTIKRQRNRLFQLQPVVQTLEASFQPLTQHAIFLVFKLLQTMVLLRGR